MKVVELIILVSILASCSMSPDKSAQIEQKEESAKIAQERANRMGQLPGTPENLDSIKRDNRVAQQSRNEAREIEEDSWLVVLIDILMGR